MYCLRLNPFILTAAHCISHTDNGYVEKVDKIRVRVPLPKKWEIEENKAKLGQKDNRFYNFYVVPKYLHIFPDYLDVGNPNTGDDLGLIQFPNEKGFEGIIPKLKEMCYFWELRSDDVFGSRKHLGTNPAC